MLWHQLFVPPPTTILTGLWEQGTIECKALWACLCVEQTAIRQEPRPSTSNPRHHLHKPFPACSVIPALALPPLPSNTYQPPAAVPLPESGSSSLDTVDKQQQLIYLTLSTSSFPSFLSLFVAFLQVTCPWHLYFQGLCDYSLKAHLLSISALAIFCLSALLGCYSTSLEKRKHL